MRGDVGTVHAAAPVEPGGQVGPTGVPAPVGDGRRTGPVARVVDHLRTPLYRNGYSLALSTIASSALGMVFWLVAARLLPAEVVGVDSALISAVALLGTIAQLNLTHGLNRFLPRAGRAAATLLTRAYLVTAGLGVVVGVVYLAGIDLWSPSLAFITDEPWMAAWFVVATALTCVFALQDGALTGLRRAGWVPIENIGYGVAKLGLLGGLVVVGVRTPVFLGWTVPYVALVAAVSWLLYRRLLPEHVRRTADRAQPLDWRHIGRFVAGDYVAALLSTGLSSVLPILVLELTDAAAAAYFSLAWSIAYTLFLLSRNMGMSLVAEVAHDEARLDEYSAAIVAQSARLLAAPVAVLVLAAPVVLQVFGDDYAAGGATLLRLLALSAMPGILVSLFMARARIQRRMRALVAVMAALNGGVLALSLVLVPRIGITGVGVAWVTMHTVAAAGLLATELRSLWLPRLDHRVLRAAVRATHLVAGRLRRRRRTTQLQEVLPSVGDALGADGAPQLTAVHTTVNSVAVAEVDVPGIGRVVVKVAADAVGDRAIDRQRAALRGLAADEAVLATTLTVPSLLASGRHEGRRWLVERLLGPGAAGVQLDGPAAPIDLTAARATLAALHAATACTTVVDDDVLDGMVDRRIDVVAGARGGIDADHTLRGLRDELRAALGRAGVLELARVHGDVTPGNLVRHGTRIVGLIDWEDTVPRGLPAIDLCHLALTVEMERTGRELGDVVRALLDDPARARDLDGWPDRPAALPPRALVLLTWLHHVAAVLAKSSRAARSPVWHARNVTAVLSALRSGDDQPPPTKEPR